MQGWGSHAPRSRAAPSAARMPLQAGCEQPALDRSAGEVSQSCSELIHTQGNRSLPGSYQ
jgi:hypothetical protein